MRHDEQPDLARRMREFLRPLREWWYLVVLCVTLTTAGALAWSLTRTEMYDSTSRLLIEQDQFDYSVVGLDRGQPVDPERQTATNLALVKQTGLAQRVIDRANVDIGVDALLANTTVESDGSSQVMEITVRDEDPRRAAALATSYAREYVRFRADNDRSRYTRALRNIDESLRVARSAGAPRATLQQLRDQRNQVALLTSLVTGDAKVLQRGRIAADPAVPKPERNALIGLIFGLLLGVMLTVVRERLDPRLREEAEVVDMLPGVPVIAAVPSGRFDFSGRPLEAESFRGLSTTLSVLDAEGRLRSLLVTSATVAEGKSTTSLNLAMAMAENDENVLLLEADLRRRGLSVRLGLEDRTGASDVLAGTSTLTEELVEVSLDESITRAGGGRAGGLAAPVLAGQLRVLPAGAVPRNPHKLLSASRLERLFDEAADVADRIVVDGTPIGLVKDMLPIARRVDGVVVVARLHHTRRKEMRRLHDALRDAHIQPFGVVIFDVQTDAAYDRYMRRR